MSINQAIQGVVAALSDCHASNYPVVFDQSKLEKALTEFAIAVLVGAGVVVKDAPQNAGD